MFRMANQLNNQLIELEVSVSISFNQFEDGKTVHENFCRLSLSRNQIAIFSIKLDDCSPY